MKNSASQFTTMVVAASMALTPVAAQANTRASDGGEIYSPSSFSQPGLGRETKGSNLANTENDIGFARFLIGFIGTSLVGLAILTIVDDADDQSPGT